MRLSMATTSWLWCSLSITSCKLTVSWHWDSWAPTNWHTWPIGYGLLGTNYWVRTMGHVELGTNTSFLSW